MRSALTWAQVAALLRWRPRPACVRLEAWQIEHPQAAGMTRSVGLPVGQLADWRMAHPSCHGLHVREYVGYYTAHLDKVHPRCNLAGHMAVDAPLVGGGAALGGLVGLVLGESRSAMVIGALIGGALGAAAASAHEAAGCAGAVSARAGPAWTAVRAGVVRSGRGGGRW